MLGFRNREKRQAFLFITLGVVMTIFSYQNFQYPEHLKKSSIDVDASLNASGLELQRTRQKLNASAGGAMKVLPMVSRTQVTESAAPMKLKLKRAPAKSSMSKKKSKKSKTLKKPKKKKPKKTQSSES